jgi:iron(III) transport system ATP-binding protein
MSQVRCVDVRKAFSGVTAVDGLSLEIAPGEILALLGPSGCGKTTVLRLIAGFERLDDGQICIGERLVAATTHALAPERRNVGMVFQQHALFPHLNVAANISFGLSGNGAAQQRRIGEMLDLVGLTGLERRMPHELSGGQQQRVALARALAPHPAVLLLDEPFSNLDADLRTQMRIQVRAILKQVGTTALFVTHDQEEALFIGDRVAVMRSGRLEQAADPRDLFLVPATRFVAEFIGIASFLPATVGTSGLETELGPLPQQVAAAAGTAAEILVRPDDLEMHADDPGNATIIGRTFRGGEYLYDAQLDSGRTLRCLCNHIYDYPPRTRVRLTLAPGHALAVFPAS